MTSEHRDAPAGAVPAWFTVEGSPFPFGQSWVAADEAYNFSLYAEDASAVTLLLYSAEDLVQPVLSYRLDPLVQAGMITPQVKELARATAAAARDLSSALPALRTLADSDDMAATKLIDLLIAAGHDFNVTTAQAG